MILATIRTEEGHRVADLFDGPVSSEQVEVFFRMCRYLYGLTPVRMEFQSSDEILHPDRRQP